MTHQIISPDGQTCTMCGQYVNGPTNPDGTPVWPGFSLYHTDRPRPLGVIVDQETGRPLADAELAAAGYSSRQDDRTDPFMEQVRGEYAADDPRRFQK